MKKTGEYFQHGDLLLGKINNLAVSETELVLEKTNVIIEGEHTGHAHRLFDGEFQLFTEPKTKDRYLKIVTPTALRHEEHKQIDLDPGLYKIGIIKEYDPLEKLTRNVLD